MKKREREYRERIARRIRVNAEDEAAKVILRAVGRLDLHRELACIYDGFEDWPKMRVEDIHDHWLFQEYWPMRLQYRHRNGEDEPISLRELLMELHRMPRTLLFHERARHEACGVVTHYHGGRILIHNRPEWIEHEPAAQHNIRGITRVVVHPFEPAIEDIAARCRDEMAREEDVDSNADWREAFWEDYEDGAVQFV